MTRATNWTSALLLAAVGLSTGCVSQGNLDNLESAYRKSEERNIELEQQLEEARAKLSFYSDQANALAQMRSSAAQQAATISTLRTRISELERELAASAKGGEKIIIVEKKLPQEVSDALRDLAAANADLMIYDADRGMIRLRSDLTFGLGSATVNDKAKAALARLARVLNNGAAGSFDIQVIGHTDGVPVTSARGRQLHIDNRGLSSNRGDSVARVLIANGVKADRVVSGGRGATQPIAPNNAKGQSQANRRVEIYLVKGGEGNAGAAAPAPAASDPVAPAGGGGEVIIGDPDAADDPIFK